LFEFALLRLLQGHPIAPATMLKMRTRRRAARRGGFAYLHKLGALRVACPARQNTLAGEYAGNKQGSAFP